MSAAMTPDQLARVERLRDAWVADAERFGPSVPPSLVEDCRATADALTALLREREALRAALALDAILRRESPR